MTPRNRHRLQHATLRVCSDMAPPVNPGAVLYFVVSEYKGERYIPERNLCDMSRTETLNDLRSGELYNVVSIIETEVTDAGLSSRDVTEDMMAEAEQLRQQDREPIMSALDRLLARLDHAMDERKHWSA